MLLMDGFKMFSPLRLMTTRWITARIEYSG
ncbi:hypothetical protein BRADI_2g03690v3 [Brachypodium distachyon]|uniref:Uncharacterized protein n=1 Tax=Brachypodium distachyon TaxID=15368 RepID=A0A2K2D6Q9_BRADI|nr:hypothetical protein BRADI_2g03690v3 [Brachypodium distachyon]